MTLHLHHLRGCSPTPLANYLKAMGILRLVAEQADAKVRGWWQDEHFCLLSSLSKEELEKFFLEKYEPTPVVAPWNGGSGFYRTWDEKNRRLRNSKNAAAMDDLLLSENPRLDRLRALVDEVRQVLPQYCEQRDVSKLKTKERNKILILPVGDGPQFPVIPKDDSGKLQVQRALLRTSRTTPFFRSALVEIDGDVKTPWLWGSGGNDGNIDYSGRFLENLKAVLIPNEPQHIRQLLRCAFEEESSRGFQSGAAGKVGQFQPAGAGGANVTTGTGSQQDTHLNPWDFVLALEGAMVFQSHASRHLNPVAMSQATAPFAVRNHSTGYASAGTDKLDRGEQWLPLWSRPSSFQEISSLLAEARLQFGRQRVNRPVDVVRAITRLGVARGIDSFLRFAYLERNGQSRLAVPLGRIFVRQHPQSFLIDDIARWMDQLQRCARDKNATSRLINAERRLTDAVLAALTHDPQPVLWQAVLLAAVEIEMMQATGTAIEAQPMPPLRPEWIEATFDPELAVEWRLALALGSAAAKYFKFHPTDSVRGHCLPLDNKSFWPRFRTSEKRLVRDPRVVVSGRDAISDCAAIVERRLIEASQKGERRLPLVAAPSCGAQLGDLAAFIAGNVDIERTFNLARAFMAVQWSKFDPHKHCPNTIASDDQPPEAWLALRLSCLPWPLGDGRRIPAESSIVRRLMAGDTANATEVALRRLRAAGVRVPLQAATTDPERSRLWAAALVFPIHRDSAQKAAVLLDPSLKGQIHA